MFEWDEDKRIKNVLKHGLDFLEAPPLFDDPEKITFEYTVKNEERFLDMTRYKGSLCCLVYTQRGENIRLISFRRASRKERRRYENNKND
jgi:uncharacterized DUF497 family protein